MRGLVIHGRRERKDVRPGFAVDIVLKQNRRMGRLTRGVVKDVLKKFSYHPHGIKVRLKTECVAGPRADDVPTRRAAAARRARRANALPCRNKRHAR